MEMVSGGRRAFPNSDFPSAAETKYETRGNTVTGVWLLVVPGSSSLRIDLSPSRLPRW